MKFLRMRKLSYVFIASFLFVSPEISVSDSREAEWTAHVRRRVTWLLDVPKDGSHAWVRVHLQAMRTATAGEIMFLMPIDEIKNKQRRKRKCVNEAQSDLYITHTITRTEKWKVRQTKPVFRQSLYKTMLISQRKKFSFLELLHTCFVPFQGRYYHFPLGNDCDANVFFWHGFVSQLGTSGYAIFTSCRPQWQRILNKRHMF
jgi:hypothetical protein